jgi:hypothetical protein
LRVIATGLNGLRQVGEVPGAALDLKSELVEGVDEDREVERQQADDDHRDAEHTEVKGAMVIVMHAGPPSG